MPEAAPSSQVPASRRAITRLDHLPRLPIGDDPIRPFAPACATLRTFLRRRGLKFTPERAAVLDAVLRHEALFHADDVVAALKEAGHRGSRATVYRTLAHLQDAGLIRPVSFDGTRQGYFEVVSGAEGPHDYLIDAETGEVMRLESDALRQAQAAACRELGFEPVRHHFHVYARRARK